MKNTNRELSTNELKSVLNETLKLGRFDFSSHELQGRHVLYATQVRSYLERNGYINFKNILISKFDVDNIVEGLRNYSHRLIESPKRGNKEFKIKSSDKLSSFSDVEIVSELRNRGYEVKAIKMVEL